MDRLTLRFPQAHGMSAYVSEQVPVMGIQIEEVLLLSRRGHDELLGSLLRSAPRPVFRLLVETFQQPIGGAERSAQKLKVRSVRPEQALLILDVHYAIRRVIGHEHREELLVVERL